MGYASVDNSIMGLSLFL